MSQARIREVRQVLMNELGLSREAVRAYWSKVYGMPLDEDGKAIVTAKERHAVCEVHAKEARDQFNRAETAESAARELWETLWLFDFSKRDIVVEKHRAKYGRKGT